MLETPVFEGHSNRVSREEIKDPTKNSIALCMQKENRSVSTYENRSVSASHQSSRGEGIFSPSLVTINYYARNFAWHRSSNVSVCISMLGVVHVCLELNGSVRWCRDVDCDTIPFMWPVDWYTSGLSRSQWSSGSVTNALYETEMMLHYVRWYLGVS